MKRFITRLLIGIGIFTCCTITVSIVIGFFSWIFQGRVPGKTILEVNLECELIEYVPDDPVARIMLGGFPVVRDIVEALERASEDERVVGLVARIGAGRMGLAKVQELRDAVQAFRESRKPAFAFSETFGEAGPGNGAYYLATAFDEIYLQPSGDIGLTGLMYETPFIRGTLDKLGIVPRMDHRHEYKSAKNIYTEQKYTRAHREATQKVMTSQFGQMVRGIAQARGLTEPDVRSLIDGGPFLGREALDAGLVDGLGYRDELVARVRERFGKKARFLYLDKYLERAGRPHREGKAIALIYGVGGVYRGKSGYDPIFGDVRMGSDTVAGAFRAAIEDKTVKAILFRIDSPGGSYVASDAVWRETVRAREAGKPVIVSMSDVAGSGGYFVAMAADKIVSQPGTITGSIGVLGGKLVMSGLWDKVGFAWDEVHTSTNATMWTRNKDYNRSEWARFQTWLDRVYEDFTEKVAEGRRLPQEKVLEIAKGRVWSGEDARDRGLVDALGGFPTALCLAKEAAGIPDDEEVRLKCFPRKKSIWKALLGREADSSEREAVSMTALRILEVMQPVAEEIRKMGFAGEYGVLRMPNLVFEE